MRKRIKDPIHGFVELDELAQEIINKPSFQRMHYRLQLAWDFLVYPGATHTRLGHSIGVYHLAKRISDQLKIGEDEKLHAIYAALLHDLGHGPFSHASEPVLKEILGKSHEEMSREIIARDYADLLESSGIDAKRVGNIITGEDSGIAKHIVFSEEKGMRFGIDADILDYLPRDDYYTGAKAGDFDSQLLISSMKVKKGKIVVDARAIPDIDQIIIMRNNLATKVYFHKTCVIANQMWTYGFFEEARNWEKEKFLEAWEKNGSSACMGAEKKRAYFETFKKRPVQSCCYGED